MKFTQEQITKAKQTKSAEELLALAKENGMELTEEQAAKCFSALHANGALADNELANVSGGGCGGGGSNTPKPKFAVGSFVRYIANPVMRGNVVDYDRDEALFNGEYMYDVRLACPLCSGEIACYLESSLEADEL